MPTTEEILAELNAGSASATGSLSTEDILAELNGGGYQPPEPVTQDRSPVQNHRAQRLAMIRQAAAAGEDTSKFFGPGRQVTFRTKDGQVAAEDSAFANMSMFSRSAVTAGVTFGAVLKNPYLRFTGRGEEADKNRRTAEMLRQYSRNLNKNSVLGPTLGPLVGDVLDSLMVGTLAAPFGGPAVGTKATTVTKIPSGTMAVTARAAPTVAQQTAAATRTLTAVSTTFGLDGADRAYVEAKDAGLSEEEAGKAGARQFVIDGVLTFVGGKAVQAAGFNPGRYFGPVIGKAAQKAAERSGLAQVLGSGLLDGGVEGVQGGLSYLNGVYTGLHDFDLGDFGTAVGMSFAAGGLAGTATSGTEVASGKMREAWDKFRREVPKAVNGATAANEFAAKATPEEVEAALAAQTAEEFESATGQKNQGATHRESFQDELAALADLQAELEHKTGETVGSLETDVQSLQERRVKVESDAAEVSRIESELRAIEADPVRRESQRTAAEGQEVLKRRREKLAADESLLKRIEANEPGGGVPTTFRGRQARAQQLRGSIESGRAAIRDAEKAAKAQQEVPQGIAQRRAEVQQLKEQIDAERKAIKEDQERLDVRRRTVEGEAAQHRAYLESELDRLAAEEKSAAETPGSQKAERGPEPIEVEPPTRERTPKPFAKRYDDIELALMEVGELTGRTFAKQTLDAAAKKDLGTLIDNYVEGQSNRVALFNKLANAKTPGAQRAAMAQIAKHIHNAERRLAKQDYEDAVKKAKNLRPEFAERVKSIQDAVKSGKAFIREESGAAVVSEGDSSDLTAELEGFLGGLAKRVKDAETSPDVKDVDDDIDLSTDDISDTTGIEPPVSDTPKQSRAMRDLKRLESRLQKLSKRKKLSDADRTAVREKLQEVKGLQNDPAKAESLGEEAFDDLFDAAHILEQGGESIVRKLDKFFEEEFGAASVSEEEFQIDRAVQKVRRFLRSESGAAVVYHGSPHEFDRFTTEFQETGQGAQDFGWGLYFTESGKVGEHYRGESGTLYKVKLLPDDNEFMNWHEPVIEQDENVQSLVERVIAENPDRFTRTSMASKGETIYSNLVGKLGSQKKASQELLRHGVKGMRYPVGSILGEDTGEFNFVVFDENDVQILEAKNPKGAVRKFLESESGAAVVARGNTTDSLRDAAEAVRTAAYQSAMADTFLLNARNKGIDDSAGQAAEEINKARALRMQSDTAAGYLVGEPGSETARTMLSPDSTLWREKTARPEVQLSRLGETIHERVYRPLSVEGQAAYRGYVNDAVLGLGNLLDSIGLTHGGSVVDTIANIATIGRGTKWNRWRRGKRKIEGVNLTRAEALGLVTFGLDPENADVMRRAGFDFKDGRKFTSVDEKVNNQLFDFIGDEGLQIAEWQFKYYNGPNAHRINDANRMLTGRDMITKFNRVPRSVEDTWELVGGDNALTVIHDATLKSYRHFKHREGTKKPLTWPRGSDGISYFMNHADRSARFAAFAVPARDAQTLLNKPAVKDALLKKEGVEGLEHIQNTLRLQVLGHKPVTDTGWALRRKNAQATAAMIAGRVQTMLIAPSSAPLAAAWRPKGIRTFLKNLPDALASREVQARMASVLGETSPIYQDLYMMDGYLREATGGVYRNTGWFNPPTLAHHLLRPLREVTRVTTDTSNYLDAEQAATDAGLTPGTPEWKVKVAREWEQNHYRSETASHGMELPGFLQEAADNPWMAIWANYQNQASRAYSLIPRMFDLMDAGRYKDAIGVGAVLLASSVTVGAVRALMRQPEEDESLGEAVAHNTAEEIISSPPLIGPFLQPMYRTAVGRRAFQNDPLLAENAVQLTGAVAKLAFEIIREGDESDDPKGYMEMLTEVLGPTLALMGVPYAGPADMRKRLKAQTERDRTGMFDMSAVFPGFRRENNEPPTWEETIDLLSLGEPED